MRLYKLTRSAEFDEAAGYIIRAETAEQAKEIARVASHGCEFPVCEEVLPEGDPGVILRDFLHG